MRVQSWWQYGLIGAVVLSLATAKKIVVHLAQLFTADVSWMEALGFAGAIFAMGFLGGVVVWAGRGLSQRFGLLGDSIVGTVVMIEFFLACMLLFAPDLLGPKWEIGGLPMLALGALLGCVGGAWIGYDLRKKAEQDEAGESERDDAADAEPLDDQ